MLISGVSSTGEKGVRAGTYRVCHHRVCVMEPLFHFSAHVNRLEQLQSLCET